MNIAVVTGASKAFVLSYSRAMNQELKGKGIRMMAMNPGWVKTEFFNHAFQTNSDNEVQYFNRLCEAPPLRIPLPHRHYCFKMFRCTFSCLVFYIFM